MSSPRRALAGLAFLLLAGGASVACGGPLEPAAPGPGAAASTPSASASAPVTTAKPAPSAAASAEPTKPAAPSETIAPAKAVAPVIKMLDAGAEPKRALRYVFKPNTTERAEVDMRMAITSEPAPKMDLPTMRTVMRVDGKEITPEGDLRMAFDTEKVEVLKDVKVDPKLREALEKDLGALVGMRGKARVSPRGVASEIDFELPAGAPPQLRAQLDSMQDSIRNMYLPFPEEPVGKGAKWEVRWNLPVNGAFMEARIVYTLQKLEAGSLAAEVETTFSAPEGQPLTLPGLPPDARAMLVSIGGSGKGKAQPSLDKLIGSGENKVAMTSAIRVVLGAEKIERKTLTEMTVGVRPAKAPAAPAKKP